MTKLTLRDLDNRDDNMAPYEFTGTAKKVIGYLDGPLRGDLTNDVATTDLDEAIELIRADKIEDAAVILIRMSIYLIRNPTKEASK